MSKRAAVLIGVSRTGGLQPLQAVEAGVDLMHGWARSQGFDRIERITDEGGEEVYARGIRQAIQAIVEPGDVEQLVVYFAGHGVNKGFSEYWLLTDAPDDANEAVNLAGTERMARHGTVPHVVFVSDACRTAAEGIQAQAVEGSLVFPNVQGGGGSKPVDLFYAASLGSPALEVKDPEVAAGRYTALYTDALHHLLTGGDPEILTTLPDAPGVGAIHPRPLRDRLPAAVLRRLRDRNLDLTHSQVPDAQITSDPEAWLSRVEIDLPLVGRGGGGGGAGLGGESSGAAPEDTFELEGVREVSRAALGRALAPPVRSASSSGHVAAAAAEVEARSTRHSTRVRGPAGRAPRGFADEVARSAGASGADPFEVACGFQLRGARVASVHARRVGAEIVDGSRVRVKEPIALDTVLLRLADGRGVLLPAIPDFLAHLTFEEGELAEVSYEPSKTSWRWSDYRRHAGELRELRSLIARSVRHGVFRLEGEDALPLARRIRYAKSIDPALAIYAGYAFDGLHRRDLIEDMAGYLRSDLSFVPFDVALLAGEPIREGRDGDALPFVPLLAQGWALLEALGARLPWGLEDLRRYVVPSLWTLFDPRGAERLREHMTIGR